MHLFVNSASVYHLNKIHFGIFGVFQAMSACLVQDWFPPFGVINANVQRFQMKLFVRNVVIRATSSMPKCDPICQLYVH